MTSWDAPGFALAPAAPDTGPFPRRAFLEAWWETRSAPADELVIATAEDGLLPLRVGGGVVSFCGDADLTDYHSPLGSSAAPLGQAAEALPGHRVVFDSLPAEAATDLIGGLAGLGGVVEVERHASSAVLRLPASTDEWMAGLRKKDRHEIRRKRRRFASDVGEPILERRDEAGLEVFIAMHRSAAGEKGSFMTDDMERFFRTLHAVAGASVDLLVARDTPMAAAFGFECDGGYYLYNSAYDPAAGSVSPGIVMHMLQIERQIERGATVFDFLKGEERYKYELGAKQRPLLLVRSAFP